MSAKKAEPKPAVAAKPVARTKSGPSIVGWLTRWLLIAAVVGGALGGSWYALWARVRPHVLASGEYQLDPKKIEITPPPAWIRSDIRAEVARDVTLNRGLSVLDEDLTVRVAQAFSLHPWVAKVTRVSKRHPAGVQVDLVYRQPALLVQAAGDLYPVDAEGVVLPGEDFAQADARKYPLLTEITTKPAGPVGAAWGDVRVAGAGRLATMLKPHWEALKLFRIVATQTGSVPSSRDVQYHLFTHANSRVLWGRAPGFEGAGEPVAKVKLAQLLAYVAQHGSLEGTTGPQQLDVQSGPEIRTSPRRRIEPLPN